MELEMPTFLMLCSIHKDSSQKQMLLYLIMYAIFQNMDIIWPNEIVIDKNNTKYKALMIAFKKYY